MFMCRYCEACRRAYGTAYTVGEECACPDCGAATQPAEALRLVATLGEELRQLEISEAVAVAKQAEAA